MEGTENLRTDSEVHMKGAHPLYGAFSRRWSDSIKLAHNSCRPDDWLKLTANMSAVLFAGPNVTQN